MKSTTARGYGYRHAQERRRWKKLVDQGICACTRCGRMILPGMKWELDHAPGKIGYRGPAHQICNRRAGGKVGAAITHAKRRAKNRTSRQW